MPKYRLPVLLFFLHSFRHSLPKPSVAADPAAEKAEEARDSLLSGECPAPQEPLLSGEHPVDSRITDCCRGLGHSGRFVTSQ
jgi:hypothetical protein